MDFLHLENEKEMVQSFLDAAKADGLGTSNMASLPRDVYARVRHPDTGEPFLDFAKKVWEPGYWVAWDMLRQQFGIVKLSDWCVENVHWLREMEAKLPRMEIQMGKYTIVARDNGQD